MLNKVVVNDVWAPVFGDEPNVFLNFIACFLKRLLKILEIEFLVMNQMHVK